MTDHDTNLLTQEAVIRWNHRTTSPVDAKELNSFIRDFFKKARTPEEKNQVLQNFKDGVREIHEVEEQIRANESKELEILDIATPSLKEIFSALDSGKSPPGCRWVQVSKVNVPTADSLVRGYEGFTIWVLPRSAVNPEDERPIRAIMALRDKRTEHFFKVDTGTQMLQSLRYEAAIRGIPIPEEFIELLVEKKKPSESDNEQLVRVKGGKKRKTGPRKATVVRRAAFKLLKAEGLKGEEACKKLNDMEVPLASPRLQTIYKGDWVEWLKHEPKAFYKQWHADHKRGLP